MNRQYWNYDFVVDDPLDAAPRGLAFGIGDLVLFLRRRWLLIGAIAAVIVIGAGVLLTTIAPQYTATAELKLIDQRQQTTPIADLVTGVPLSRQLVQQEITTMRSKSFMIAVVMRLEAEGGTFDLGPMPKPALPARMLRSVKRFVSGLLMPDKAPATAPPLASDVETIGDGPGGIFAVLAADLAQYGDTADQLRAMVDVAQVGNSYVIGVSATSADPALAARIANATAAEYTRFDLEIRGEAVEGQVLLLRDRVDDLGRNLDEAETAVVDFQQQVLGSDNASNSRLNSQISDLGQRLVGAQADVVRAQAQYDKMIEIINRDGELSAADVLTSPILADVRQELSRLRIERSRTLELFGADSTQVSRIDAVINRISEEIKIETARILSKYETELNIADTIAAGIDEDLVALEEMLLARSRNALELGKLRRIADANRVAYEEFLTLATESAQYRSLQQASVQFLSYAEVPRSPSAPRSLMLLAASGIGGLAIGLGIAILIEVLNTTILTERELRQLSGLPVIGSFSKDASDSVTKLRTRDAGEDGVTLLAEGRAVSSFLMSTMDHEKGTIMVTSAASNEDAPMVALLFADALARQNETVLLLDARTEAAGGPIELGVDLAQQIDIVGGVPTLTLARIAQTDPQLLSENRKRALMKAITAQYDHVVIDAPPVLSSAVTLRLVRNADTIVITTRWNATKRHTVQACMQKLHDLAAGKMYMVMTNVNRRVAQKYEPSGAGRVIKTTKVSR